MSVSSVLSIINQHVAGLKSVIILLVRSLKYVLADEVLAISKPKITLIVAGNELQGHFNPLKSGTVFESDGIKARNNEER